MKTKSLLIFSRALVAILLFLEITGCGGGNSTFVPTPTPTPVSTPTNFVINAVSPTIVDEGQDLEITYTGPAPGQSTNPVVATFVQGSLPSRQGQLVSFENLGNNTYSIFFKVPTGFASDRGIIPISSTLTLSNSQASSAAQNIEIAPPPTLAVFPEELYLGDTGVSLRIHGNGTHFDQSTIINATSGLRITNTTLVSSDDLVVTLDVTATAATSVTFTVSSGGSDPRKSETVVTSLPVAASLSPLIGASGLSVSDGAPGTIIQVQGLFNPPDGTDHNTIQWIVGGQAITVQPVSETSGALSVMVPLWPNSDASIYSGPAQIQVRASGQTSQFNFTIDPLPPSPFPRGAVFTAILDGFNNSVPPLQSALTAIDSSPPAQTLFQAATGGALGIVSKLRQFVATEASGAPAIPPGGTQPISLQQFDLMEQILLTSGLFQQAQSAAKPKASLVNTAIGEDSIVLATVACEVASKESDLITSIETVFIEAAIIAAVSSVATGPAGILVATALVSATETLDILSDIFSFTDAICSTVPISLIKVVFQPGSFSFTNTNQHAKIDSITGTFSACLNPVPLFAFAIEKVLEPKIKKLFKFLPVQSLVDQIVKKFATFLAEELVTKIADNLRDTLKQFIGVALEANVGSFDVALTSATVTMFSANPGVAVPLLTSGTLVVQPIGPGATQIRGDLSKFKLLTNPSTTCDAEATSLDIPGNAAQVNVQGPPLVIPTNSGGSTGIIPGTLNGKPIDKAYVAVPDTNVVSVLNADAQAGIPPITTIPMPLGFSPTATAANPFSSTVFVISYTSPNVVIIDASSDTVSPNLLALPVVDTASFSGGNCMVCGVVADPIANQVIFDTADGYFVFDVSSNRIVQSFNVSPAENFGYNPLTRQVLSPFYAPSSFPSIFGLDLIDLGNNSALPFSDSVGPKPDAAAVDYSTNVAIVANEPETVPVGSVTFINLNSKQAGTSSFSALSSGFQFPDATGLCSGGGDQSEWTMLAVDPANHFLFLANEFSDCAGILDLPPKSSVGVPRAASQFRFGEMPASPDGLGWNNSHDPHGTAVFTSVVDGRSYGFLVRLDGHFVGRIDLLNFFNAAVLSGTPGAVDMTTQVTYLATLP